MRVLFVSSGNRTGKPGIIVFNQGEYLRKNGIDIEYYLIKGKGLSGYIKNVHILLNFIKKESFDIVHAHYSLSAFVATFSMVFASLFTPGKKKNPLIVSLMGSDTYQNIWMRLVARIMYWTSWNTTIVKTERMRGRLRMSKAIVLPNGVDTTLFTPMEKEYSRGRINYKGREKLIVFIADPHREEKNYQLAVETIKVLKRRDTELFIVYQVDYSEIPHYMNAADVLLLTSKWEGSVNVVKEAMACNLPVVSTDVGDVRENTLGVDGCYICDSNPEDLAKGLEKALAITTGTNGREKLLAMKLDSDSIAKRIIAVYNQVLTK